VTDEKFYELLDDAPKNLAIFDYLMVTRNKLRGHSRIAVSYSGGSDSDTIVDIIELVKPENSGEVKYVFFDTGLEWEATHRHIAETEEKYGITIERRKAKLPIPAACKKYGIPFIAKEFSKNFETLQRHNFNFAEAPEMATVEKYGHCGDTMDWYFDRRGLSSTGKKKQTIAQRKYLREFMATTPPTFAISSRCCDFAKKNVAHAVNAEVDPDLEVTGMRRAEGGVRVSAYKTCFTPPNDRNPIAQFRPLWFWTDADKATYKKWRGLRYSDCYEVWGFERTGCVGCPCTVNCILQLEIAAEYEPNKVKAAYAVFGESYKYRAQYNRFKKSGSQMTFEDMEEITNA
jgi:3'-phosphoadenosine 5'-phosphosulfate sulfotransferase (PAPS reductase)/FAD synthetase